MAVCLSQAERDRKGPGERASLSCLGESTGRMEGESSLHRDTRLEHAPSLSLTDKLLTDTVVLESGDLGRGTRTSSPPSVGQTERGVGDGRGHGCSLSVAPSLQVHFPSDVSPHPVLT